MDDCILAVFRSRTQTADFKRELKKKGIDGEITGTPQKLAIGCGLSVKISAEDFAMAKKIAFESSYDGFVGFYEMKNGKIIAKKF